MARTAPVLSTVARGALRRCPRCGQGKLFRRWFSMRPACPRCGLLFERKEGAFLGSMSINYAVAGLAGFGVMLAGMIAGWRLPVLMTACFATVLVVLAIGYPFSKTLWAAFDLLLTTPEDVESDRREG